MMKRILLLTLLLFGEAAAGAELSEILRNTIAGKRAQVGIAVVIDGKDTLPINDD